MEIKPKLNLEEIQQKLYQRLVPSGWSSYLKSFILSEEFMKILVFLDKEAREGRRFGPTIKELFSAFETCPWKDLKVCLVGQSPYPYVGVSSGRAFCCGNTGRIQKSLEYIFQEIQATVYPGQEYVFNPDLTRWANQGVLLLNSTLTVPIGKNTGHEEIWRPFTVFLLDTIKSYNPGMIYLAMGRTAEKYIESIPDKLSHKIIVSHPASSAYKNKKTWNSEGAFLKVNEILKSTNNTKIIW